MLCLSCREGSRTAGLSSHAQGDVLDEILRRRSRVGKVREHELAREDRVAQRSEDFGRARLFVLRLRAQVSKGSKLEDLDQGVGASYPELEGDVAVLGRVVQLEWHALCEVLVREERLEVDEGGTGRFAAAGRAQIVCDTRILEARDEGAREAVAEVGERSVAEGNCGKGGEVSARFRRHGRENRRIHGRNALMMTAVSAFSNRVSISCSPRSNAPPSPPAVLFFNGGGRSLSGAYASHPASLPARAASSSGSET